MTVRLFHRYKKLLSSVPLDQFLNMPSVAPQTTPSMSSGLFHSNTNVVLVGVRGVNPHDLKCWLYFPEDNCPFYRATVFSHYAEANCPAADAVLPTLCRASTDDNTLGEKSAEEAGKAGPYWSLMFEISESTMKPVDHTPRMVGGQMLDGVVADTIQGESAWGSGWKVEVVGIGVDGGVCWLVYGMCA